MTGKEPYPELDSFNDENEITRRYKAEEFPNVDEILGGKIIHRCWLQLYQNANECLKELKILEERYEVASPSHFNSMI